VQKEELQNAPVPGIDRKVAPAERAGTPSTGPLSILALQRSAGNRAVGSLLVRTGRTSAAVRTAPFDLSVQREPGEPGPDEEDEFPAEEPESRPIIWPEDAEAETNEPCFAPEFRARIGVGVAWADSAAADLTARPPNLQSAVSTMGAADECWAATDGTNPGKAVLDGARATIGRALARVAVRIEPVDATLIAAKNTVLGAGMDASMASTMMTTPAKPTSESEEPEEPEPCFEEGDQGLIAVAVSLTETAAAEFGRRPPDYRKALATLRSAIAKLGIVGGREPGRARLAEIAAQLVTVADGVDSFLSPVEAIVVEAAADVQNAADDARGAAELTKPGPYAAGGSAEEPGTGG